MENWLLKLREIKKASGMTTKQIAKSAEIPEPTLEKIFSGQTKDPKYDTVKKLVHFFGYTVDDLDTLGKKKSPTSGKSEVKEIYSEEDQKGALALYELLISLGYVTRGNDLTEAQADILIGLIQIIDAVFRRNDCESPKVG